MNDPFSNLNFGKSMGRFKSLFLQKKISNILANLTSILQKKSQNLGKFEIFGKYMGPIFGQNFGKCMGQFSFSQRHIPTKKNLEYPRGREY